MDMTTEDEENETLVMDNTKIMTSLNRGVLNWSMCMISSLTNILR